MTHRQRLQRLENQYVSLGEARAWIIARHEDRQLDWICHRAKLGVKPTFIKLALYSPFSLFDC